MNALMRCTAVAFLALLQPAFAVTDVVPRWDVKGSCRDAQAISADGEPRRAGAQAEMQNTYKACMQNEQEAHDQLAKKWTSFTAPSRQSCMQAGANPSPSFVELLTCLEMNSDQYMLSGSASSPAPRTRDRVRIPQVN